ncbi:MAG: ornithine cyclodeaminase family protein [Nitrososphaerales archaeon]
MDLSTLLLSRSEVEKLVSMKDAIEALRSVFTEHAAGKTKTYPRVHIPFDEYDGSIGYLEAAVDNLGMSISKIASLYHSNPSNGLPRIIALITASRIDNGLPIAIMDGNYLTMLRTGAVSALASDYLSKKNAETVGIIGAGVQGRGQLLGLAEIRKIRKALVYDISTLTSEKFAHEMSKSLQLDVKVANSVKEMTECDIICSATPAKEPLIVEELIHPGLHINSVGIGAGLGKREVDFKILRKLKIVVDDLETAKLDALNEAFRDNIVTDRDIHASLGEIVAGKKEGRIIDGETTIFVSSGIGIQDAAVAKLAFDRAVQSKIGRKFNFFD